MDIINYNYNLSSSADTENYVNGEGGGIDNFFQLYDHNETLEEYLLKVRGPKHLPLNIVIPLTIIYVVIFVTGVIGNVAVCVVIIKNVSLHTATNYYLFSLAISDLTLLLLGLPNDLSVYWQQYPWIFGEEICKLRALVSETTSYTSVLTIVAFSMERYLAICHPLHSYAMSGLRRAIRIVAGLWAIGFICATPFAIYTTVNYVDYPIGSGQLVEESAFCAMLEENLPPIYELSFLFFFLIPMLVIIVLYVRIGLRIRRTTRPLGKRLEGTVHGETKQSQSRRSIVRMLVAVVVTFFLCWAPFHAQRLLYLYGREAPYYSELNEWLYYIAGCFYYISSTINPILYNIMSVKYRLAFQKTLCCYSKKRSRFSRDIQSSFRDTIVHTTNNNYNSEHWKRNLTWLQNSRRSVKSNSTDVVVMIAPISENGNSDTSSSWKKSFLHVTVGSSKLQKPTICISPDSQESNNGICSSVNRIDVDVETCI